MKIQGVGMSFGKSVLGLALLACLAGPAGAQTKPAESASKVKKVFHYTKVGGYVHVEGIRDVTAVLNSLAPAKGFQVTHSADATLLTLDFLKTFNVIIWDNNVSGGNSVPDPAQRKAVLDYVNQGGGWLLIHGAGDHQNSWNDLLKVLGTTFTTHGAQGQADLVYDQEALNHKELKWMLQGLPPRARLHDEWYSFQNTVRGLPGVTVIATAANGATGVLKGLADGSQEKDYTYQWAKEYGKGRVLYNSVGHGGNQLFAQADSFATKSVWQNIRFVAGDFQNGCTNKNATNYDPAARVDNGQCATTGLEGFPGPTAELQVEFAAFEGRSVSMRFAHAGRFTLELRDASGRRVWRRDDLEGPVAEIRESVAPGIHYLKAVNGKNVATRKVVLF